MAFAAAVGLFRFHADVTCLIAIFDFVTGDASALHRGMNVVSGGVVRVAIKAIRMFVHTSWMRARVRQLHAQNSAKDQTHEQPYHRRHGSPVLACVLRSLVALRSIQAS